MPNLHLWQTIVPRLKERESARRFAETISDRFTVLDTLMDPVLMWDTFKCETHDAAQESIADTLMDPVLMWDTFKCETHDAAQESIAEHQRARQNLISQETLEATDACCTLVCQEIGICTERWAEYFEKLYQLDPPTVNLDVVSAVIPLPDPPSLAEVREAISKLKSGKAASICGIPAELLKASDRILALRVIVECRSEFGRGLLAAYIDLKKAFDIGCSGRLQGCDERVMLQYAPATTLLKAAPLFVSCTLQDPRCSLKVTQLGGDNTTVHQESLWEILRLRGIPTRIIELIANLYTGTESAVKCGGGLSSFFPVSSGVRQDCVFASTLFNTCMDWILVRPTVQRHCGATLGIIKVTVLDFANDAILSESLETLVVALDAISNEAKPLGPCAGSWGTVGGTMCLINGCILRLAQDLLPAQSGIANSGYMATC
ncbi:uncharacterized protein [Penaeus vannamei]|uniref:uncharacterized protein n=1 Tax=Penaeus vannamei TaxID=6689 RepID=UPI00387F96FE